MFSNSIKLFTISGFDIKIDFSWLLIAALITWSLSKQFFPVSLPGLSQQTYFIMALLAMLCFFASLLLHELAHSVVARRFGISIKGITLFLFGGVAEFETEPKLASVEFWVALAGPVMSLALSFGFWVLALFSEFAFDLPALTEVLSYLAAINLVLALFNLLPAFPLDGGRVLRAYLWHRSGDLLRATETAAKSGTAFAYALMALGVLALFQGVLIAGLWQIMIGLFLLAAARSSYQSQLAHVALENKTVSELMTRNPIVAEPNMTLSEFVNQIMLPHRVSFVPVVEQDVLLGHMDQHILSGIDRENWGNTRISDVFAGLDKTTTIAPDMPAEKLLTVISDTKRRKFLVVQGRTLVGVVSLADLVRYLQVSEMLHGGRQPAR